MVRFGFYTPNFDFCGDALVLSELAGEAESAGWDGFFIWDHLQFIEPVADPWVALTAMALRTVEIRLGTLVTPLPRRHLGKLARELITLDNLSNGRITLGAGAGYPHLPDYVSFGDVGDQIERAAQFDEALEVLSALLSGDPVNHDGAHYRVHCDAFQRGVQRPRVPVWVAATWPAKKPTRRAARWDGAVLAGEFGLEVAPDDVRRAVDFIGEIRGGTEGFDIIRFGQTTGPDDVESVGAVAAAGATWWIEYVAPAGSSLDEVRARVQAGPPRLG
ncbi:MULTISPECIES: LLM class flavin-dependent oxidoreductase [unclassified Mycobacterium]|uniref:LLM class flavin-dependent oxidoreductase n=1 Tax=unclassified Mycobacterium TaxID=2642494 RepID=UPI0029C751E4|nr:MULTISPECIES: LLM class flavin-dependent oxidoreductase [unclassified Mycobacterium]